MKKSIDKLHGLFKYIKANVGLTDPFAILIFVFFIALLIVFPRNSVIEDFWYHLGLGHWIAQNKSLFLYDHISFQPYGRPQLYPLLVHTLTAIGEWIGGSPITGSIIVRMFIYVGNLIAVWWAARKMYSPTAGYLALLLIGTDQSMFYSAWSLMPASLIGLFMVLLVYLTEKKMWKTAGIVLAAACYTHLTFPWLIIAGLGLLYLVKPEMRNGLKKTFLIGILPVLPFIGYVLGHLDSFYVEKAVNYNPIPGYGPFGYASHYHISALILIFTVFAFYRMALPNAKRTSTVISLLVALSPVLIGIEKPFELLGKIINTGAIKLPTYIQSPFLSLGSGFIWIQENIHPMTMLNIGTIFALIGFITFFILGLRLIMPLRGMRMEMLLSILGAVIAVPITALAFNVEMTEYALWDGFALLSIIIGMSSIAFIIMRLSRAKIRLVGMVEIALGIGIITGMIMARIVSIQYNMDTFLGLGLFISLLILFGSSLFAFMNASPIDKKYTLPPGMHAILCILLALMPAIPFYGGRYFWHVGSLMTLIAFSNFNLNKSKKKTKEQEIRDFSMLPLKTMLIGASVIILAIKWPLFIYSRGFRQNFKAYNPPVLMAATSSKEAEYETKDFLDMISWVKGNVPKDEIIHTDDPRTAHMIYVFTERVADNGMFWEAQTKELQELVSNDRAHGIGAYVYKNSLPNGAEPEEEFGEWKVMYIRTLPFEVVEP